LNNFVSQDEIGADDEQNWETISVLTNSILGIPSSVISVSTKNQIVMIRNLAVLFFFDQVAHDNSFQGEFTLTSSHSLSLPKILKMNILTDEIVLPDEIVEFVQSKESANVLLRGGCIPVISGRQQQQQQHRTKTTTSTNRQLEFSRADEIETDDENEEKKFTNVVDQRNEEEHEETKSSIRASCEALRHILTSYSSMVDAALGNSEELSESSKHRTALQEGMKHIEQIEQELKFSFSKTTTTKNFVSPQSQGVSPGTFVQDQILGSRGEMIMTEELQAMIIRVIRERDQAKEETMKLREELRMI
jgi:hypothetical protein